MSVTPNTILDYILETLREDSHLSDFKKWFLGEPPATQYPSSPWGWIEWIGGRQTPGTASNSMTTEDRFYIVPVMKHPETAERSVVAYVEAIESALASDRTLDGNVAYSWVENREKIKDRMKDHNIIAVFITLHTKRKK